VKNGGLSFDVIVVGGGPAGLSAATFFAKKGFSTLVLERGKAVGSKNMYGGRIYSHWIGKLFPGFEREAPIHRWVRRERFSLVTRESAITVEYAGERSTSFTTTLTEFTKWLAEKAEESGAILVTEARVDRLVRERGRVAGVAVGDEVLRSEVVVIAEGANRVLSEREGLARPASKDLLALGVKEVIQLSEKEINDRFGLAEGEGASWMLIGEVTDGLPDGGFIYTFRDSVALGATVWLGAGSLVKRGVYEFAEKIRTHPRFKHLFEGGKLMEYSSHLTVTDPLSYIPERLAGPGYFLVGDAAGLLGNLGYTFRGVDFAVYSGYLAAAAYEKVVSSGDWSAYDNLVKSSSIYREIAKYSRAHDIVKDGRLTAEFPEAIENLARAKLEIEGETPKLMEVVRRAGISRFFGMMLDLVWKVRKL